MIRVVHVKLANGRAEEFDAADLPLEVGEVIIAEDRKRQVLGSSRSTSRKGKRFVLKAPRRSSGRLPGRPGAIREETSNWKKDAFRFLSLRKVKEKGLNMKLVRTEVFLDRSKSFSICTAEKRVDFRELVGTWRRVTNTDRDEADRVRDEAKDGLRPGGCGRELCSRPFREQVRSGLRPKCAKGRTWPSIRQRYPECAAGCVLPGLEFRRNLELKKHLPKVGNQSSRKVRKGKSSARSAEPDRHGEWRKGER